MTASAADQAPLAYTSDGIGPAVLLLHGQPGARQVWFRLRPLLVAAGFRVIAVDRPGYGRTAGSSAGFAENAERALALLEELGIADVTVFAHSWSGGVALAMALQEPTRIRGLVLQGSVGGSGSITFTDRVLALPVVGEVAFLAGLRAVAIALPRTQVRRRLAPELADVPHRHVSAIAAAWSRPHVARTVTHEQRALVAELPQIQADLFAVHTPVVVLIGAQDRRVSAASQRDLARRLPNAEVVEVDGGHLLATEAPEEVVAAITRVAMRSL